VKETLKCGTWDRRLQNAMSNALCHTGYQQAVEAALWSEACHNLLAARQLTLESDCLQIIPETHRRKLLHEILLATMPGNNLTLTACTGQCNSSICCNSFYVYKLYAFCSSCRMNHCYMQAKVLFKCSHKRHLAM
jgi:hypothetical protein